jgi:hypothetical protein
MLYAEINDKDTENRRLHEDNRTLEAENKIHFLHQLHDLDSKCLSIVERFSISNCVGIINFMISIQLCQYHEYLNIIRSSGIIILLNVIIAISIVEQSDSFLF